MLQKRSAQKLGARVPTSTGALVMMLFSGQRRPASRRHRMSNVVDTTNVDCARITEAQRLQLVQCVLNVSSVRVAVRVLYRRRRLYTANLFATAKRFFNGRFIYYTRSARKNSGAIGRLYVLCRIDLISRLI